MARPKNQVFIWNKYRQWRPVVLRLLGELVDEAVLNELRKNPPRYIVADKLEWLDKVIREVKGLPSSDVCSTLLERFPNYYQFVRGYHGCRAESPDSYKHNGILPSDPASLNEIARQIFRSKEGVEAAIRDLDSGHYSYREHNKGKVCLCIQPEHLIEDCGHYLLYGSEYLGCIAARIGEEQVLRGRGRAMIVECNVPTNEIPSGYLRGLLGQILREIAEKNCAKPTRKIIVFGFEVPHKIEPQNVVGFHFPTNIHNPLRYGSREN